MKEYAFRLLLIIYVSFLVYFSSFLPIVAENSNSVLSSAKEILSEYIEKSDLFYFNQDLGVNSYVEEGSRVFSEVCQEWVKTVILNGSWDNIIPNFSFCESDWNLELPVLTFWNYTFLWWYTSSDIVSWYRVVYTDDIDVWDNNVANVYAHRFCNWIIDESWNCVLQDVIFDANWWKFNWGFSQKQFSINKIMTFHTPNVLDSWEYIGSYAGNSNLHKQITLTWASSLLVKVTWWTEWSLWDCSDYTLVKDKDNSQVAKLCWWSHLNKTNTKFFHINWDSVWLTFRSDGNNNHWWDFYGYYAVIYWIWEDVNVTDNVEIPVRENSIFSGREKRGDDVLYAKWICYDGAIESDDGAECRSPKILYDAWYFSGLITIPSVDVYERRYFESHTPNIVNGKMIWSYGNGLNISDVFVFTWANYFKTKVMWWTESISYDYVRIVDWNNFEVAKLGWRGLLCDNIGEYLVTWDSVEFNFRSDGNNNRWGNLYGYSAFLYGVKKGGMILPEPFMTWWIFKWWFDNPEFLWEEFNLDSYLQSDINSDITLYAKWELEDYLVTFQDEDGNVLYSWYFEYWSFPEYVWGVPGKIKNEEYSYVFNGWDPEISKITWDVIYTPRFLPVKNKYKISFISNWPISWMVSNDEILADYWSEIVTGGDFVMIWWEKIYAVPSISTAQYSFNFDWWESNCWNDNILTHNCIITWNFSSVINEYRIRFFDDDWITILNELILPFGEILDFNWPQKLWYKFVWWEGGTDTVSWNADYIAVYEKDESQKKVISYNIKYFKNDMEAETQVVDELVRCLQEKVDVNPNHIDKNRYVGYSIDDEKTFIPIEIGSGWTIEVYYKLNLQSGVTSAWWWILVKKEEMDQEHSIADVKNMIQGISGDYNDEMINSSDSSGFQFNNSMCFLCQDKEVADVYEWAYENNITTMVSLNDSDPDGVVKRWHLAKMVVNYAINVLWQELPEKIPSYCRWNDNKKDWESEEIKDYAVKSCALWLMWLDMPKFLPNLEVTRAQFGTIMSRLLWWKKYAWWTPYYRKHLNALKENNIMTQIENPEKRIELRWWVWLMLRRSCLNLKN